MFRGRAVVSGTGVRLFGHARLAQSLADPFMLLPVLRARQCEGDRRKATECGYPRVRDIFSGRWRARRAPRLGDPGARRSRPGKREMSGIFGLASRALVNE